MISTAAWGVSPATPHPLVSAAPSPAAASPLSAHEAAERCQELVKQWIAERNVAKTELAACRLHRFNEACERTAEARKRIAAPGSPCAQVKQVKEAQLPEINCEIVQVPESCAGQ